MSNTAPGDLETLRAFLNTHDPAEGGESIDSPAQLQTWLVSRSLLGPGESVDGAGHWQALRLRDALRRLARANHDEVPDPVAAGEIDELASGCRLAVRVAGDGSAGLAPLGVGTEGALARLLAIFFTATVDGTWERFKICDRDTCRWAFFDHSRNRSGRFCGTGCGNAEAARAYRRRKAAAAGD